MRVEGVVVGGKRRRCRPARNGLHHRCFHFHKIMVYQETPDTINNLRTLDKQVAGFFIDHEVKVALAVTGFGVRKTFVLVGQRSQRLGEHADLADIDGELTLVGFHH